MATLPRHHALHFYTLPYRYVSKLDNPLPARYHAKRHTTVTLLSRSQPNDANTPTPPNFAILNLCLTKYNVTFRYPYRALHNSELHCTTIAKSPQHHAIALHCYALPCHHRTERKQTMPLLNATLRCPYSASLDLAEPRQTLLSHDRILHYFTFTIRRHRKTRPNHTLQCSAIALQLCTRPNNAIKEQHETTQRHCCAISCAAKHCRCFT